MWLKLNLTQLDLAQDWKADEHYRWPRCWSRTIQQTKKREKKMPKNFNMSSRMFLNISPSFSAEDKRDKRECQISDKIQPKKKKKGLRESQTNKKGGICSWMPTMITEWYHRQREEVILNVNQYTCGTLIRSKMEEFGFFMVNVITFY